MVDGVGQGCLIGVPSHLEVDNDFVPKGQDPDVRLVTSDVKEAHHVLDEALLPLKVGAPDGPTLIQHEDNVGRVVSASWAVELDKTSYNRSSLFLRGEQL